MGTRVRIKESGQVGYLQYVIGSTCTRISLVSDLAWYCLGHTNLIPWIAGSSQIPLVGGRGKKHADIRYFRTTGRKQHNFPKVTFTLDGI
jgi:hypothetical protein